MKLQRELVLLTTLVLLVSISHAGQIQDLPEAAIVGRVGRSALLQAGDERVLVLQGSPYQVGFAHGRLLAKDVATTVDQVLLVARAADSKRRGDFFAGTLEEIYKRTLPYIPDRYRQELAGLADGAGLDRHKVELANIFPEMFHCSGFALMGKATKGGKLIHGRILDYMTEVGLQDRAVVIVTKGSGRNTTMVAGFAGFLGCVTGLNDKQLALGEMGMGGLEDWDGLPMAYLLRQALEECNTLEQALSFMKRTPRTCEYAYVVSDAKTSSAAGIHARPDLFTAIYPGEMHPLLSKPVPDCVLVSADKRYDLLVQRVKDNFGEIDIATAVEIMKRPVSMKSNLHNAVLLPEDMVMYLASAVSPTQDKFQACFQTYYTYDMKKFLAVLGDLRTKYKPTKPERIPLARASAASRPPSPPQTERQRTPIRKVSRGSYRTITPAANKHIAELLEGYSVEPEEFEWQKRVTRTTQNYEVWEVTFPSPYTSPDPENNTVWCEYFKSNKRGPKPAAIVLHHMEDDFTLERVICHSLADSGIDAMLLKMAYYGARQPVEPGMQKLVMGSMDNLLNGIRQSCMDVRRAARLLSEQEDVDEGRIGICGISLGAIVGALTIGVDGEFPKAALVLGGGDLSTVILSDSREVRELKRHIERHGITEDRLRTMLEPIEPLTFASRAGNTDVLMFNARGDLIIPPACTEKLADALPKSRVMWYDTGHETMALYLVDAVAKIREFFEN